jgi:hypothetical protein
VNLGGSKFLAVSRFVIFAAVPAATILCGGCVSSQHRGTKTEYVRSVDCSEAPEMKDWTERARRVGDDLYPQVCALLAEKGSRFPQQLDICFKKHLQKGRSGEAGITQVYINAEWAAQFQNDPVVFDQLIVHEMTHVAQAYQHRLFGGLLYWMPQTPSCWQEGMADYACFKLGLTRGVSCPQCGLLFPHYQNGYSCAGAFLLYLEASYNTNLVRELNRVLRRGSYSDEFFLNATGKRLPDLWAEFQKTPAFTPAAARALELRRELGYENDKPPKDIEARFKTYVDQRAGESEKDFLKSATVNGEIVNGIQTRIALYLYATQPGGTPEAFAIRLAKNHTLPGFAKDEHGNLSAFLGTTDLNAATFPISCTLTATKKGDSSVYRYTVVRESADTAWKLIRASRSAPDGKVIVDIPIGEANSKSND